MGGSARSDDSSDEEDATWKAAIQSIASTTTYGSQVSSASSFGNGVAKSHAPRNGDDEDAEKPRDPQKLKHYQIKAQKLLEQLLEKSLDIVEDGGEVPDVKHVPNEGGVRLFKNSPVGILLDSKGKFASFISFALAFHFDLRFVCGTPDDIQRPTKKPRLVPQLAIEENSKKFRREVKSITVDGAEIIAAAKDAAERSLARLIAKEAAAKEKAKKEEERVAELKKTRGEKWLPSIAKEMQMNGSSRR
ncbi:unnamed protein product [Linum tenue]|uniref:Uncharacterized protein n=1 Tax=Linum tenue TaxID=586396 RepID=A0AAV0L899_9ROSI|nr:unnamed protein product [Linum tenue]